MQKTFLLFLSLALMALPMRAQDAEQPAQRLIVWKMDGTKVYFELTDEPVTTFADGSLIITANSGVFSYPLAQMAKYTHEGLSYGTVCHKSTVSGRRNYQAMKPQRFWEEVEKEVGAHG